MSQRGVYAMSNAATQRYKSCFHKYWNKQCNFPNNSQMCSIKWSRTRRSLSCCRQFKSAAHINRSIADRIKLDWIGSDRRWHKFWTCFWFIAKLAELARIDRLRSSNLIKSNRCIKLCIIYFNKCDTSYRYQIRDTRY